MRAWRETHDITQEQAATEIGASQSAYSDWEQGRKMPGIENALRIARATDGAVPVESWLNEPAANDDAQAHSGHGAADDEEPPSKTGTTGGR